LRSQCTQRFWKLFHALPKDIQQLAAKNYALWRSDPSHPSLRFRRLEGAANLMTIRIGDHHRALGMLKEGCVTWVWIGTHAEYDKMVR
jgi:hypothetical protein